MQPLIKECQGYAAICKVSKEALENIDDAKEIYGTSAVFSDKTLLQETRSKYITRIAKFMEKGNDGINSLTKELNKIENLPSWTTICNNKKTEVYLKNCFEEGFPTELQLEFDMIEKQKSKARDTLAQLIKELGG